MTKTTEALPRLDEGPVAATGGIGQFREIEEALVLARSGVARTARSEQPAVPLKFITLASTDSVTIATTG